MKKILLAVAVMVSANASALKLDVDDLYVSGGLHLSDLDYGDDNAVGFGIGAGVPIKGLNIAPEADLDFFLEAGYIYFGETEYGFLDWSSSASTIYTAAKVSKELKNQFSVYGKAGLGILFEEYETRISEHDDTSFGILFGGGLGYRLTEKLGVNAEYVFYPSGVSSLSAGASFSF